jgi:hypothetical protein
MDPSVKAAWISSIVAVAVAVIGVIATGVAQWRGSKTAHANALALFKRQADEQEGARVEAALERKRTAFLADRRAVYVKFLAAMKHFQAATTKYEELMEKSAALTAASSGTPERDVERLAAAMKANFSELEGADDTRTAAHDDVFLILQEMLMLAPGEVSIAAVNWFSAIIDPDPQPFALFVNAARLDVGAQPLANTAGLGITMNAYLDGFLGVRPPSRPPQ